jgi:hypothetical protein
MIDYMILALPKTASTYLKVQLDKQSIISTPISKESRIFDQFVSQNLTNDEIAAVVEKLYLENQFLSENNKIICDFSSYIIHDLALVKQLTNLGYIKNIIVLLRNPTERAISHYYHERRRGREKRAMCDALQARYIKNTLEYFHHGYVQLSQYQETMLAFLKNNDVKYFTLETDEITLSDLEKLLEAIGVTERNLRGAERKINVRRTIKLIKMEIIIDLIKSSFSRTAKAIKKLLGSDNTLAYHFLRKTYLVIIRIVITMELMNSQPLKLSENDHAQEREMLRELFSRQLTNQNEMLNPIVKKS